MKNFLIKKSFFTKTFLFFLIIAGFICIISILSTQYYIYYQEKKIEERYIKTLHLLSRIIDEKLYETFNQAYSYAWSDDLNDLRKSKNPFKNFINGYPLLGTQIYSLIHSIYYVYNIYSKNSYVVGKNFCLKFEDFINLHYPDINYHDITNINAMDSVRLPWVTFFKENDLSSTNVIPYYINDKGSDKNCLLININQEKITFLLKQFLTSMTANSNIMIIDGKGNIISNTEFTYERVTWNSSDSYFLLQQPSNMKTYMSSENYYSSIDDKYFINNMKKGKSFRFKLLNNRRLFIPSESRVTMNQRLYYIASIPYKDLYIQSIPIGRMALLISLISLFFSFVLSFFVSKNLYTPIKSILNLFVSKNTILNAKDEFSFLSQKIINLLQAKEELSTNLTMALPMVAENYLIKILNDNDYFIEDDLKNFLNNNNIWFEHPNFIVSIIRLSFTSDFYQKFNREQQLSIINQTYKLFKNAFLDPKHVYILTISKNELCIIFNLPVESSNKDIIKSFNNIFKIFQSNENYVDVFIGIGRTHYGFLGLRESYKEAYQASLMSPFSSEKIKIYEPEINTEKQYLYSINEENQLLNYLLCGFEEESYNLIKKIMNENLKSGINIDNQKDIYMRIYYTCFRALNMKDISPKLLLGNEYINLSQEYQKININNISNYILLLINRITRLSENHNKSKFDVSSIIEFINNNFNHDISLENIALEYKISTPHLSRLLKESLGMPFQQYLNNQRVKKAKYYLKNTSKSIDEISNECGFNSRFTFIRMFKILEGITPTQFRTIQREKVIDS